MNKRFIISAIVITVLFLGIGLGVVYVGDMIPSERELWRIEETEFGIFNITVVNDLLLSDVFSVDEADDREYIYAIDKRTGKLRWSNESYLGDRCGHASAVHSAVVGWSKAGDQIYISSSYWPTDETQEYLLYSINSSDGNVLWEVKGYAGYELMDYLVTAPTTIYVASADGSFLAIDSSTGNPIWKQQIDRVDYYSEDILIESYNQFVFYSYSGSTSLVVFNALDGSEVWRKSSLEHVDYLMFSDRLVYLATSTYTHQPPGSAWGYVGSPYALIALDIVTGSQVWELSFGQEFPPLVEIRDDQIYIQTRHPVGWGDDYHELGELMPVDKDTGETLWRFNDGYSHGGFKRIFGDDALYVGTEDGFIFSLDNKTGKTNWQTKTSDVPLHLLLYGDVLVVVCKDNHVAAFDVKTGAQKWVLEVHINRYWDLSEYLRSEDGVLYMVDDQNQTVYALDIGSGKELWSWNHNPLRNNRYVLKASDDGAVYVDHSGRFFGLDWFFALKKEP